jgi:DNA-binding GntR family transcriptional regulator
MRIIRAAQNTVSREPAYLATSRHRHGDDPPSVREPGAKIDGNDAAARETMARPPAASRNATGDRSGTPAGPLYRQVVQALKQEIVSGVYPVDSQLPTEDELRHRFKVSRHTVREALRALRDAGLVESRQGFGTTVLRPGAPRPYVHEVASINALIELANATRYEVGTSEIVPADAALAERLGAAQGSKWLRIEGYRYAPDDRRPVCWTEVYVHGDFAGVARLLGRRPGPIYLLIEDLYGESVAEVEQTIRSSHAPEHVAARLGVKAGVPVIAVRRVYRLSSGVIGIVAENLYPVDRFQLSMTLRRSKA